MLEIRYDDAKIKQLERELRAFGKNALPRVMSRGLNRTATQARTASARFLSKETGVKVGDVRKRLLLHRAAYNNWRSAIIVSGKRLSLQYLSPKKTARGLSVKSGRKRITIRRAFFALKGWFIRLPRAGGYKQTLGVEQAKEIDAVKKVARLPIGRIRGPILSRVFSEAQSEVKRIHTEHLIKLQKNIHDQVQLTLRRRLGA
jgi:hypothetical protein